MEPRQKVRKVGIAKSSSREKKNCFSSKEEKGCLVWQRRGTPTLQEIEGAPEEGAHYSYNNRNTCFRKEGNSRHFRQGKESAREREN
jgi:hypothetical protein